MGTNRTSEALRCRYAKLTSTESSIVNDDNQDNQDEDIDVPKQNNINEKRHLRPISFSRNDGVHVKRRRLNDGSSTKVNSVEVWLKETVQLPQYLELFNEEGYDDMDT